MILWEEPSTRCSACSQKCFKPGKGFRSGPQLRILNCLSEITAFGSGIDLFYFVLARFLLYNLDTSTDRVNLESRPGKHDKVSGQIHLVLDYYTSDEVEKTGYSSFSLVSALQETGKLPSILTK